MHFLQPNWQVVSKLFLCNILFLFFADTQICISTKKDVLFLERCFTEVSQQKDSPVSTQLDSPATSIIYSKQCSPTKQFVVCLLCWSWFLCITQNQPFLLPWQHKHLKWSEEWSRSTKMVLKYKIVFFQLSFKPLRNCSDILELLWTNYMDTWSSSFVLTQ